MTPLKVLIFLPNACRFLRSECFRCCFHAVMKLQGMSDCLYFSNEASHTLPCGDETLEVVTKAHLPLETLSSDEMVLYIHKPDTISFCLKSMLEHACKQKKQYIGAILRKLSCSEVQIPPTGRLAGKQKQELSAWNDTYECAQLLVCRGDLLKSFLDLGLCLDRLDHEILSHFFPLEVFPIGGIFAESTTPEITLKTYVKHPMRPCLFLDRDGVINVDKHYPHREDQFEPFDGIVPIIRWAKNNGWFVIVISNQAGIAKGIFSENDLHRFNNHIKKWLKNYNIEVDDWFHCPFHPQGTVERYSFNSLLRKPHPGMVLEAMSRYPIDLEKSIMIGDKESDELHIPLLQTLLIQGVHPLGKAKAPIARNHGEILTLLQERSCSQVEGAFKHLLNLSSKEQL